MNTSDVESVGPTEREGDVTPLELFFDLVFVFAVTQITGFLVTHLSWPGVIRGIALLAVVWWAWVGYSWLTNAIPAEEILPERLVILLAMAAMLVVALTIPHAFGTDAVYFAVAYFVVRALHVVLYGLTTPPETRAAILRLAPGFLGAPILLIVSAFVRPTLQAALWTAAIVADYGIARVRGVEGFHVQASHFIERHRLIIIIALGESIVAVGVGMTGLTITRRLLLAVLFGFVLIATLWWLYFDYITLAAERHFARASDRERTILARDSYSYIHLMMMGGIIFIALGIEQTLAHLNQPLTTIPAVALCGGGTLYLCGHNAYRFRDHGTVSVARAIVAIVAVLLIPVTLFIPSLISLGLLTALFVVLAAYETVRSEDRRKLRSH